VRDYVIGREAARFSSAFKMDLRSQKRPRIAHRQKKLRLRKTLEDGRNVIAVSRRLFDPALDSFERNPKHFCVRFDHQNEQIAPRVRRIERSLVEGFENSLVRE